MKWDINIEWHALQSVSTMENWTNQGVITVLNTNILFQINLLDIVHLFLHGRTPDQHIFAAHAWRIHFLFLYVWLIPISSKSKQLYHDSQHYLYFFSFHIRRHLDSIRMRHHVLHKQISMLRETDELSMRFPIRFIVYNVYDIA